MWTDLAGTPEIICWAEQRILLDQALADKEIALAHALAHLDLHAACPLEPFSMQQELEASWLAEVRLDRAAAA